ncbi:DUF3842 family protein [Ignavigranum ruoffiae]|uniref:DUF3842 family protein n=1 Tax=Ignavigranum ruoffiae TaxID=89093 RepID=UPI0024AD0817|nr:DUF3842 family protein [Ignavigranum ruoffiae]
MKNILIVDGQGGKIGASFVDQILKKNLKVDVLVVGTNALATQSMMKAGANQGATGENAVIYNSKHADIIIAPIGLMIENALYGEVTTTISNAILKSKAKKIILPFSRCGDFYFITESVSLNKLIDLGMAKLIQLINESEETSCIQSI